jgi:hypothetical protein
MLRQSPLDALDPRCGFGPMLSPPWILHRPFFIAGHWQRVALLVFAPHRGAFKKSAEGFPFLSKSNLIST